MPKIPAKTICLIRTSALGDTVHALAFVNGLRKGYPDAQLTWILQDLPHDMVKHQKAVDRFIPYNRNMDRRSWLNLLLRLRSATAFDLTIVPQVSAKASLLALFVRSKIKLGFDFKRSREGHWLAVNRHIPPRPPGHAQDLYFEFLEYLGIDDYPVEWNFTFTEEERAWQRAFFKNLNRPAIGFVIASSNPEKDWPVEHYAKAAESAAREWGLQPLLIGGPSRLEQERAETIVRLCAAPCVPALEKPIRRTLLQIDGCRILVSPDTGPLHMAVALDVPTVGLYGYSDPRRCGPYRKFTDLLINHYPDPGEEAAPITRKTKPGRMVRITPEAVLKKIALGLETYPARHREW